MTQNLDFEQALTELEALIQCMEQGDLPLEAALQKYERGIQLIRLSQDILTTAEQRVTLLHPDGDSRDFLAQDDSA